MRTIPTCISTHRLETALDLDYATALAVRCAMRKGYGEPGLAHWSFALHEYVERVADIAGLGVGSLYGETLRDGRCGDNVFFVDVGDPYKPTLIFNYGSDRWTVGCWGDLVD